jgi:hypothetical protein
VPLIAIPSGDKEEIELTRKGHNLDLRTIEGIQDYLTVETQRFQRGVLTSPEARAVAGLALTALALEKAKRERDNEAPEEVGYQLIQSRSRGLVSGSGR